MVYHEVLLKNRECKEKAVFSYPDIYDSCIISKRLGVDVSCVENSLEELINKKPEFCVRLKKDNEHKIITSGIGVSYIKVPKWRSWGDRYLRFESKSISEEDAREKKKILETIVKDYGFSVEKQEEIFGCLRLFDYFLEQNAGINNSKLSKIDLSNIYLQMKKHKYSFMESFKKDYSISAVREKLGNLYFIKEIEKLKADTEFLLANANEKLIYKLCEKNPGAISLYLPVAQDALLRAVKCYDPSKDNRFSVYAYKAIFRALRREIENKRNIYLHSDKTRWGEEIINFIRDKSETQDVLLEEKYLKEKIKTIMEKLSCASKSVIRDRILIEKPLTLNEAGIKFNKTREWARLEEKKALEKLRHYAEKYLLQDYLVK